MDVLKDCSDHDSRRPPTIKTALWDRWRVLVVAMQKGPFVLSVDYEGTAWRVIENLHDEFHVTA